MERAVALFFAAQLAGCSFIGMHSVPPVEGCTEDKLLPTLDAVSAAVLVGGGSTGIVANETKSSAQREAWATNLGIGLIVAAIPLAISAWWGFRNAGRCRAAHRQP